MSDFSTYYQNKIGDHMLRGQAFTPPATIYIALFTASTGLASNNPTAEVTNAGYARQALTLSAFSGGSSSNSEINFPQAAEDWATVTHFAIVDHASNTNWGTGVNVLMWDILSSSRTPKTGDVIKFLAGALEVDLNPSS